MVERVRLQTINIKSITIKLFNVEKLYYCWCSGKNEILPKTGQGNRVQNVLPYLQRRYGKMAIMKRQQYEAAFKAKVALEIFKSEKPLPRLPVNLGLIPISHSNGRISY
jgi:hypothetical protein